jgi:hypothetical protein
MALIEARGAVVSKNALMARVWPDRIVEGCEYRRQQRHLQKYSIREQDCGEDKPEHDCQWQTNPEKSFRKAQISPNHTEIRVGGIGEQKHGEREFGQRFSPSPVMLMRSTPNPSGPRIKPATVNTIGPLIKDRSIRHATAL